MATPFCFIFTFAAFFLVFSSRASFLGFTISRGLLVVGARELWQRVPRRQDGYRKVVTPLGTIDSGFHFLFSRLHGLLHMLALSMLALSLLAL